MARRLWDKGEQLNELVHQFTVGNDPEIDQELVYWDAIGSGAQARMLLSIGVINQAECSALLSGLKKVLALKQANQFEIPNELEDCHTAIENLLIQETGEAGMKIHTGRSRNDQILLAMRLYLREKLVQTLGNITTCIEVLLKRYYEIGLHPMPGYTHFQPAMPSSVGLWLHAFVEAFLDLLKDGLITLERINLNPLGSASGFGSSLPLNRELTSELLGFARPQRNPIDTQNSRGRAEMKYIRFAVDIAGTIEKIAWDMILYSSREFGFFVIPRAFTTGSSIMPQKHNPDILELLRARAGKTRAAEQELLWITGKLPSNYHRDLQYTKEPVVRAAKNVNECLVVLAELLSSFSINEKHLQSAMSADLYATYDAYERVKHGMPFREAYRLTAELVHSGKIDKQKLLSGFEPIQSELQRELKEAETEFASAKKSIVSWSKKLESLARTVLEVA